MNFPTAREIVVSNFVKHIERPSKVLLSKTGLKVLSYTRISKYKYNTDNDGIRLF